MKKSERWQYETLQAFHEKHYSRLLTDAHIATGRKSINVGDKEFPDHKAFYILIKDKVEYALSAEFIEELPILVEETQTMHYDKKVYDVITEFRSARFKPEKHLTMREMVNDLCCFEHSSNDDFILWKLIVIACSVTRLTSRVSSPPAFGKDSAVKVLGGLLGDSVIVANPTIAKLEYALTNKLVVLNELANLGGDEKKNMEHFLLSTGDLSNTYEKRSRAGEATKETYDIGKLSLLLVYNDLDCYPDGARYFDRVFQQATLNRFLPLRLRGRITEQIIRLPNAEVVAEQNAAYYKQFIRSMMWYRINWWKELDQKSTWKVKYGRDYGLSDRWASNFDTIRHFIVLYSKDEHEAQSIVERLLRRHKDYLVMVGLACTGVLDEFITGYEEERIQ